MPSSCCNSPKKLVGDITKHHVCESCGQVYDEVNEKEWWEQMRRDEFHFIEDKHSCCLHPHDTMLFCRRLIAEANRRRDEGWREKLEGIKRETQQILSSTLNSDGSWESKVLDNPLVYNWNAALDEAKKLFT